jgi:hypothetical protein
MPKFTLNRKPVLYDFMKDGLSVLGIQKAKKS